MDQRLIRQDNGQAAVAPVLPGATADRRIWEGEAPAEPRASYRLGGSLALPRFQN